MADLNEPSPQVYWSSIFLILRRNKLKMKALFIIQIIFAEHFSCGKQSRDFKTVNQTENKDTATKEDSSRILNISENKKKILAGAKKCLEQKFKYDVSMAYHTLNYKGRSKYRLESFSEW